MRKLKLTVEDLRVETFATVQDQDAERGTVKAHAPTEDCFTPPCPASVNPCITRDLACFTRGCSIRNC